MALRQSGDSSRNPAACLLGCPFSPDYADPRSPKREAAAPGGAAAGFSQVGFQSNQIARRPVLPGPLFTGARRADRGAFHQFGPEDSPRRHRDGCPAAEPAQTGADPQAGMRTGDPVRIPAVICMLYGMRRHPTAASGETLTVKDSSNVRFQGK